MDLAPPYAKPMYGFVWHIMVTREDESKSGFTGVSIGHNLILTCNHSLRPNTKQISARRLTLDGYFRNVEVVHARQELDLALLRVMPTFVITEADHERELELEFRSPQLSDNERLEFHEMLFTIGNDNGNLGVFSELQVGNECMSVDHSTFMGTDSYIHAPLHFPTNRRYCLMRDLRQPSDSIFDYHPNLPLVLYESTRLLHEPTNGRSGAAIFRPDGTIVGIHVIGDDDGCGGAVHVSALRAFLGEADEIRNRPLMENEDDKRQQVTKCRKLKTKFLGFSKFARHHRAIKRFNAGMRKRDLRGS